ncbi:MAG: rod shape-determining protein MreD [Aureispira sp.]
MNSTILRTNALRFILLLVLQFILKGVDYVAIDIYIYPLFVLLLPVGMVHGAAMLLAFFYGLLVDAIYNTPGQFASAAVAVAALRPLILAVLEPRGGYEPGKAPSRYNLGIRWFIQYSASLFLLHTIWVVTLEQLQVFSWLWLLSVVMIFTLSILVTILYQYIFNPKE